MQTAAFNETELMTAAAKIAAKHSITDEHDKEDAIQEIALRMHQAALDFDVAKGSNVKAFQWVCGMGRAKDFLKCQDRERTNERTVLFSVQDEDGSTMLETFGIRDADVDLSRAIAQAFEQLSGRQAQVAQAHLLRGETFAEIAQAQGITTQTAQEANARAVEKLRKALAEWRPAA